MAMILVVEDDLDAAATIARILRRDDHEVEVVRYGRSGSGRDRPSRTGPDHTRHHDAAYGWD